MARIPTPDRLPVVLSPEEVALLLAHAPNLKYRAALSVAYGCGLRISEIANLKITDIDSARMLIRVEQGKGRKDRYVMLSPDLLDRAAPVVAGEAAAGLALPRPAARPADHHASARPRRRRPRSSTSGSRCTRCGTASPRTCSRRTHDIRVIQVLLGHKKLDTTAVYTRVALKTIRDVESPLALLTPPPPP